MEKFAKTILEINLNRVSHNYKIICSYLKNSECGAVVKSNAYGIGIVEVAKKLYLEGCRHFFVANLDEAIFIREYIHNCNIHVFHGLSTTEEATIIEKLGLIPIIGSFGQLETLNKYAKSRDKTLPVILHFDTGMSRLELQPKDVLKILKYPEVISNTNIRYIMSHMACPDEPNHPMNQEQLKKTSEYQKLFPNIPITFANSAAILLGPEYHFDLVRPGAALYGISASKNQPNLFSQVVTLKAWVMQKKLMDRQCSIGYGATFNAKPGDKLLTLECGYADGYFRNLSNLGYGFYNNKKLPIVGKISMDSIIVDATSLTEQEFSEITYVELLGDNITVNEVAKFAGTIGYEVLTSLSNRFKKVFIGQD